MTPSLLTDAAERFVLGARNGIVTPTTEAISDSVTTPFGLTLRTTPTPRKATSAKTDHVTTYETDGSEDASDTQTDYITD